VIDTAGVGADDHDGAWLPGEGCIEGEFEVGAVLVDGIPGGGRSVLDGGGQQIGIDGVHVADDEIDPEAEDGRMTQSAIGGDHEVVIGHLDGCDVPERFPAREDDGPAGVAFHALPPLA